MHKRLSILPLTILALCLSSCDISKKNRNNIDPLTTISNNEVTLITPGSCYEIIYKDDAIKYFNDDTPKSAKPGSIVELKAYAICDADLVIHAYLEGGEDYFSLTLSHPEEWDNGINIYKFTMPGCPVTIDCDIVGGM